MEIAQITNPFVETTARNPFNFFREFTAQLISNGLAIAGIIFLFVMIAGGIAWMTAGGDKQKIESARTHIANGLIGLVVVLSVFAMLGTLEVFFDIDILNLDLVKLIIK